MITKKIAIILLSLSSLNTISGNNLPTVSEVKLSTPTVENLEETNSSDALYEYPGALSCIGTLDENLNPVCNYLSFNRLINKNFFIWAPKDKEIIYADQHIEDLYKFGDVVRLYNNQDGGWASFVPTQNLVDMFEMKNGLMPEEEGSGYDERHPFADRDPRLYNTVVYPGMDWEGKSGNRIINTLDKEINGKKNADYYDAATNASATGLIYAKYALPSINQYSPSLKNDRLCPILFRYAEVLLTIAECNVELNENLSEALDLIDQLRQRGGHIKVDRSKYNTQDKIRELVRRERTIELAGEGLRRQDILRWKDKNGKMVAETVMNGPLYHMVGTIDYSEPDPTRRAVITPASELQEKDRLIENRKFEPYMRYWPIPQAQLEKNPKLVQNPGYN